MPAFTGVNHLALTVSDVEASTRFYTEVLGFRKVLEFDGGCVCLDAVTAFSLALLRPEGATGGRFTELTTGLDHVGLAAGSRRTPSWRASSRTARWSRSSFAWTRCTGSRIAACR